MEDGMKGKESTSTTMVGHLHDGQLTIPVEFREAIGAQPEDLVIMNVVDDEIHLKRVERTATAIVNPWFQELYDYFAPVRVGAEAAGLSDDEINEAIDEAFRAVRAEQR